MKQVNGDLKINAQKGLIQPQAFTAIDRLGLIQNSTNIPTFYHKSRHKSNKTIDIKNFNNNINKYSTAISHRDEIDFHRLDTDKYWWIYKDHEDIKELRRRQKTMISK